MSYTQRIWCTTEQSWIYKNQNDTLIECPNDSNHTVNLQSATSEETMQEVKIILEDHKTGGYFKTEGLQFDCLPNQTTAYDISWPFDVSMLVVSYTTDSSHSGDCAHVHVAPNTIIGIVTSAVSATDTILTVNSTVIDYIRVGTLIKISDGTNIDDLNYCTSIDKTNSQITVNTATTNTFAIGSAIMMTIETISNICFYGNGSTETIGMSAMGGSYIPAGRVVRILYVNNHLTDTKTFGARLEFLY